MASTFRAVATVPTVSSAIRLHKTALFNEPRPSVSFRSNCLSTHCNSIFLSDSPLISAYSISSQKWKASAVTAEVVPPVNSPEPGPVEVQIESSVDASTRKGENVFAVVMIGSRQYIVIPGRFLYTQRLKGANVDDKIILNKVLFVGTKDRAYIGQPVVTNAAVHAVVEEQGLDKEVIIFKFKRKKHYRRSTTHRQPNTKIRILGITGYEEFPADMLPVPKAVAA